MRIITNRNAASTFEQGIYREWRNDNRSLSCREFSPGEQPNTYGMMRPEEINVLKSQIHGHTKRFRVVFSYTTPIAWEGADGRLHVTSSKYSTTTSRHVTLMRQVSNSIQNQK